MKRLGAMLAWLLLVSPLAHAQQARQLTAESAPRYLILCLDGVGYDLVEEMYRRGELRHFRPPAPLINAFPSLTNPGLVEILAPLGAPPAPLTGRDLLAHVNRLHDYALPIRPWQRSLFTWLPPVARGSVRRPLPDPAMPAN